MGASLFEQLGGRPTVERVHKIFYDKVYAEPLLGLYFQEVDQQDLEDQQSDFIMAALGGPRRYVGHTPSSAHRHMFITEELFDQRHELLRASLREAGVPSHLAAGWLKIDAAFKGKLCRTKVSEVQPQYPGQELLLYAAS